VSQLNPDRTLGRRWATVIAAAQRHRRGGVNPMELWPIHERRLVAGQLEGPIIYLAIGHQVAQYTGQTHDPMQVRLNRHLLEDAKARTWSHMACILLDPKTPARVVGNLENRADAIMQPLMGSRTPRRRNAG